MKDYFTKAGNIEGHEKIVDEFEQSMSLPDLPEEYLIHDDRYYINYHSKHKEGSNINKMINDQYVPVVGGLVEAQRIGRNEPDVFYKLLAKWRHVTSNPMNMSNNVYSTHCTLLFVRTDHKQLYKKVIKVKLKVQAECYDLVHHINELKRVPDKADANTRLFLMTSRTSDYEISHKFKLDKIRQKPLRVSNARYAYDKRKRRATPSWADHGRINKVYKVRDSLNKKDGAGVWHVDHIVPLAGERDGKRVVSGLHVHFNLQVISARINLKKSNKWETKQEVSS